MLSTTTALCLALACLLLVALAALAHAGRHRSQRELRAALDTTRQAEKDGHQLAGRRYADGWRYGREVERRQSELASGSLRAAAYASGYDDGLSIGLARGAAEARAAVERLREQVAELEQATPVSSDRAPWPAARAA